MCNIFEYINNIRNPYDGANIIVELLPSKWHRIYKLNPENSGVVSDTPHIECNCCDTSHIWGYDKPMDAHTEKLCRDIKAINPRLISRLAIKHTSIDIVLNYERSDGAWLSRSQEKQLLQVIADSLGWNKPPRPHYHRVSEKEIVARRESHNSERVAETAYLLSKRSLS